VNINMLTVYAYKGCDTCRKALKFLAEKKITHEVVPIRERPPTIDELRRMLAIYGDVRKLFNTSGQDYKALALKDKLPQMSVEDALSLLHQNGNLVRRPFVLTAAGGLIGFKEEEWRRQTW
jgi:arsenate reductase